LEETRARRSQFVAIDASFGHHGRAPGLSCLVGRNKGRVPKQSVAVFVYRRYFRALALDASLPVLDSYSQLWNILSIEVHQLVRCQHFVDLYLLVIFREGVFQALCPYAITVGSKGVP